ncbi:DoxX family protein [Flavobacterium sp.]|uniref:DoxX family protein n=1 Tax=Flavobacterium sp. TaxID=239 RepID=UPI0039E6729E
MKRIKTTYWILLILFSLMMLLDGISGILQVEDGKKAFDQLGYPYYLMTIVGISKLLGVAGLLQNKWKTLKEWAFSGFAFNFIGASASWLLSGGPIAFVVIPLVMLGFLFAIYTLWKKQPV